MKIKEFKEYIGFGIAGNFAHHLDQAGEAKDFVGVEVVEAHAPKGLFPFYQPIENDTFLNIFPLSSSKIIIPDIKGAKVQMEPEVALLCEIVYDDKNNITNIKVKSFCAYNDCSVREPNAPKISQKKNWGEHSKGISTQIIDIDKFKFGGTMDNFHIASFLKSNGEVKQYGEDSAVLTYNYFYKKLKNWMIEKLNNQEDFGPLENLSEVLSASKYSTKMVVSIGATSYTDFGEHRFLEDGDEVFVVIYDKTKYTIETIENHIKDGVVELDGASILHQHILNSEGLYLKGEDTLKLYKKYKIYEYENLSLVDFCYERRLVEIFGEEDYSKQIESYLKQFRKGERKIKGDFELEDIDMKEDDISQIIPLFIGKYTQEVFSRNVILKCLRAYKVDVVKYIEIDDEY